MNTTETKKSEKIASRIMRALAILGLVAVLAGLAWVVVQGVRLVPQTGDAVSAAVSSLSSFMREAPDNELVFELETRSFTTEQAVVLAWRHEGAAEDASYRFSYSCNRDAVFSVLRSTGWETIACGEDLTLTETTLSVVPSASESRLTDIELRIASDDLEDTTLVTIVYPGSSTSEDVLPAMGTATTVESQFGDVSIVTPPIDSEVVTPVDSEEVEPEEVDTTPSVADTGVEEAPTPATTPVAPRPTPVVTEARTPADLVVNIVDTGVYVDVAGRDTFFTISPIPSDKRAAVVFTVTNRGALPSGVWAFVAQLPIDGAPAFEYTSPVQDSLAPNMQVEFTLGFDEVQSGMGAITIELVPTNAQDRSGNNIDVASVEFE